jgi:outer membrane protein TolC
VAALLAGSGCAHYDAQPIDPAQTASAYAARSLSDPALLSFLQENHSAPPAPGAGWGSAALTTAALYFQPALAEAKAHLAAVRSAERTAAQRPNPTLNFTGAYDNQIPGNPTPWSVAPVSLDFPIETAGKRRYRMDEARSTSEAETWALRGTIWQLRGRVRAAVLQDIVSGERQQALQRQADAQDKVVRLLEGQVRAGNASGADLNQARIDLATVRLAAQDGAVAREDARSELAAAIGVPRSALDGIALSDPSLAALPAPPELSSLRHTALFDRSDVRTALAQYAAAQSALQIEIARQYPDLNLGPGYQYNSGSAGDSMWQLSLSLTLPVLNQNQGPIAEARRKRAEAAAHFLTVQSQALNDVESAYARYRVAREQIAVARQLAAELGRRRNSIREMEQAGENDPLATANAEVAFDASELGRLDASLKAALACSQLEIAAEQTFSP